MKGKIINLFLLIVLAVSSLLAGCQSQPPPTESSDEWVLDIVANILTSMNNGDYQGFIRDFSAEMLTAFPEAVFIELRSILQETSGDYVSCSAPERVDTEGYAGYRFVCEFEKEDVVVTLFFKIDGEEVEGLYFDSLNLRSLSQ